MRVASEEEREALLAHQRTIEGHLARLVDENVRNRAALVDELSTRLARLDDELASLEAAW